MTPQEKQIINEMTKQDKLDLTKILFNDTQISAFLMDNLKPIRYTYFDSTFTLAQQDKNRYSKELTERLIKTIDLISRLGWIEHTSDWDPYLIITFRDGSEQFQTESGYYDIVAHDEHITITYGQDEDTEEELTMNILYKDIKTIQFEE